jgi:nicotinamidase-related amidase
MTTTTAVLIIDVQVGLIEGERPVHRGHEVVDRIKGLLARARAAEVPIVYVQDNDVGEIESPAWQIYPSIAPAPEDAVVRKPYADAFYHTALGKTLESLGTRRLIVAGCKTDVCVEATSRRAVSLGYDVTLVSDAHSTTDNSFMTAPQSIAYYNLMLDGFGLEDGFGNGDHSIEVCESHEIAF